MPEIDTAITVPIYAWDTGNLAGKTGDSGNFTLRGLSDGTEFTPSNSASEVDATNWPGMYKLTVTADENDGSVMAVGGKSSTSDIVIVPVTWTNKVNVTQIEGSDATDQIRDALVSDATRFQGADIAAILADTGTDGVAIATAVMQSIADEVLKRAVSNVEDSADAASLGAMILAAFESVISGSTWTIYKTDHSTTFATRTVTTSGNVAPIVEVT